MRRRKCCVRPGRRSTDQCLKIDHGQTGRGFCLACFGELLASQPSELIRINSLRLCRLKQKVKKSTNSFLLFAQPFRPVVFGHVTGRSTQRVDLQLLGKRVRGSHSANPDLKCGWAFRDFDLLWICLTENLDMRDQHIGFQVVVWRLASTCAKDFVQKELVLWAKYDVERAIPCLVDGLKLGL